MKELAKMLDEKLASTKKMFYEVGSEHHISARDRGIQDLSMARLQGKIDAYEGIEYYIGRCRLKEKKR